MIAFTISSRNFYAHTQVLHDGFQRFHPDVPFHAVLADEATDFDLAAFPFEILSPGDLGVPDFEAMSQRYNITELNTALKPFAFLYLFDRHPGEAVLYLDPDTLVLSRFAELFDLVNDGMECVLTPHLTEPSEYAEFRDQQALRYGINNLGFCTLRDTPEVRRAVWWWARRLEFECTIDLESGLFVDQKWADLLPAFIERSKLLRHPGYNVGYWNLAQRRVGRVDGSWRVNGQPLRFLHLSGVKIEDEELLSRHNEQFQPHNIGALRALLDDYRARVRARGHLYYKTIPYAFSWSGPGGLNPHAPSTGAEERRPVQGSVVPYLPVARWSRQDDYRAWQSLSGIVSAKRRAAEELDIPASGIFTVAGFCAVCEGPSQFRVEATWTSSRLADGRLVPNWREQLECEGCRLVARVRGPYNIFRQELAPSHHSHIYVTEQGTPLFARLGQRFPHTVGSEYLGASHRLGATPHGPLIEAVPAMPFSDDVFDCILSFDVLQHVANHVQALREYFRTLRRGGSLLLAAPFSIDRSDHQIRATTDADRIRAFGWCLLDELTDVGFGRPAVITYWSRQLRYYGDPQVVVTAHKPP